MGGPGVVGARRRRRALRAAHALSRPAWLVRRRRAASPCRRSMPMLNTIWFIPAFIQAAALAAACAGPGAQSEARHAAPALSTLQQRCEHGASRADQRHDDSRIEAAAGEIGRAS